MPNAHDKFILDTEASDTAISIKLLQNQNGEERVIAYGSFTLAPAQRRYCTTRKDLLAIVRFTQHFRHYLLGREFVVRTDHSSLQWLVNFKEPKGTVSIGIITPHLCVFQSQDMGFQYHIPWLFSETG